MRTWNPAVNLPRCSLVHRSQFLFRILHSSKTSLHAAAAEWCQILPQKSQRQQTWKSQRFEWKGTSSESKHHFLGGVQVQNLSFQRVLCKTWICFFGWFLLRIGISWDENHHPNTTIWDFLFLGSFFKIGMFMSQSPDKGNGLLEFCLLIWCPWKITNYLVGWFITCKLFAGIPTYINLPFTKSHGHPSIEKDWHCKMGPPNYYKWIYP